MHDWAGEVNKEQLHSALGRFADKKILIIGDVMLDEYLIGDTERISPEAPVPVVLIHEEKKVVGGAGNVARNISALGARPVLVGLIGEDGAGASLMKSLGDENIDSGLVISSARPTTIKTRILARQQQVLRFDRETDESLQTQDIEALLKEIEKRLDGCHSVIVSDYNKGVVHRKIMMGLREIIFNSGRKIPVLVDPKPKNMPFYEGVTLLTPNAKETSEGSGLPVRTAREVVAAGKEIIRKLKSEYLVTTLGAQGMAVFEGNTVRHIPTIARSVFDVTGAGDTVISTMALGLAAGLSLLGACVLANYAAGHVVAEVGAATVSQAQLAEVINKIPLPEIAEWA